VPDAKARVLLPDWGRGRRFMRSDRRIAAGRCVGVCLARSAGTQSVRPRRCLPGRCTWTRHLGDFGVDPSAPRPPLESHGAPRSTLSSSTSETTTRTSRGSSSSRTWLDEGSSLRLGVRFKAQARRRINTKPPSPPYIQTAERTCRMARSFTPRALHKRAGR